MADNASSQSSASPAPATQAAPSSNLRGIIAMVAAVGFFSLMDALLKTLTAHYPAMQVAALRGWAALPLVALYVLWRGEVPRLLKVRWPLHLLRGGLNVAMLALGAGTLAWPQWVGVAQAHWPLVAGLAVTGFAGQLAITEAFRHGQASWWRRLNTRR